MAPRLMTMLALALVAALVVPATAATPGAGSWSGTTRQGKAISFKVTPGGAKVKKLKFHSRGSCQNGATFTASMTFGGKYPVSGGSFTARSGQSFVKGKFTSSSHAKGTARYVSSNFDPITLSTVKCTSGKVRWSADR